MGENMSSDVDSILANLPKTKPEEKKKKQAKGPNWVGLGRVPHGAPVPGAVIRTSLVMQHYKSASSAEWGPKKLEEAEKLWRGLYAKATKHEDGPCDEVVDALGPDMNTPRVFALMEKYAKVGDGKKLYGALELLGLLPEQSACPAEPPPAPAKEQRAEAA